MRHRLSRHRGQTLILFAAALFLIAGFVGMSIDVGHYLAQRRGAQNAADAAALFAGRLISQGKTTNLASVAKSYVELNGYEASEATVTWPLDGDSKKVGVTLTHDVPKFFVGAVYSGPWQVRVKAVATIETKPQPYALIALGQYPSPGIEFSGLSGGESGIEVQCETPAAGCGSIGSNSNMTFNGNVTGTIGGNLGAVGQIINLPNTFHSEWAAGGQGLIDDPFAGVPKPTSACATDAPPAVTVDNTVQLQPGHYTSIPNIQNKTAVLARGIYCFDTNLSTTGNTVIDASAGVMMYFTKGHTFTPGNIDYTLKNAKTTSGSPSSFGNSGWDKIVVWVDNTNADGSCAGANDLKLAGNGDMQIVGAVYAPCSHVDFGGTSGTKSLEGMIVGNDIKIHGNVTLDLTTNQDYDASPARVILIQ